MEKHKTPNNIEQEIANALSTPPAFEMSDTFTERFMQRLEKRIAIRDIMFDFGLKALVLVGVIFVLAAVLYFVNWDKKAEEIILVRFLLENIVPISMILVGVAFTFFVDQVLLRYFARKRNLGA